MLLIFYHIIYCHIVNLAIAKGIQLVKLSTINITTFKNYYQYSHFFRLTSINEQSQAEILVDI